MEKIWGGYNLHRANCGRLLCRRGALKHSYCKAFWVITGNNEGLCLLTNIPAKKQTVHLKGKSSCSKTLTAFPLVSGYDAVGNYVEDSKYEEANLK